VGAQSQESPLGGDRPVAATTLIASLVATASTGDFSCRRCGGVRRPPRAAGHGREPAPLRLLQRCAYVVEPASV